MLESPRTPSAGHLGGGDYAPVQEPVASATLTTSSNSRWARYGRKWFALRWNLSRSAFSKPVPYLTEFFEIKRGDLFITLPVAIALIAISAAAYSQKDVGGSGSPPAIALLLVFAFAVRNNAVLIPATGISFERALMYHKLYALVAWVGSALHGLAYLRAKDDKYYDHSTAWSGAITFIAMSVLLAFSFYIIRRRFFEFFLRFHWILFIVVIVAGVIHGAAIALVGFVPWLLDVIYRYGYGSRRFARQHASQVTVAMVSKDIVRIQFPRVGGIESNDTPFKYEAGQYVFICVPSVSKLEWHPFSIASAPHEPMVTLYIKVSGDWTKKLAALAGSQPGSHPLTILLDGPYGAVSVQRDFYSHVVFISGGIGVTPMLSLANDLYHETLVTKSRRSPLQKAWFLWSVRDRETIEAVILDEARTNHQEQQSWLSPALASPRNGSGNSRSSDVFYAEFALSRGAQDLTQPVDQQLATCLLHGQRPDIPKALREIADMALNDQGERPVRVAVLVCGPQAMISNVLNTSMKLSKEINGVVFDVHSEVFDF